MIDWLKLTTLLIFFNLTVNAQPDTTWSRCYGGSGAEAAGFGTGYLGAPYVGMIADADGSALLLSYSNSNDGMVKGNVGLDDLFLARIAGNGDTLWTKTIGGESYERCTGFMKLSDGNYLICGRSASKTGLFVNNRGGEDAFLLKISPFGNVIWLKNYGGELPDAFLGCREINASGDLVAYGITGSTDGDINDATFIGSNKAWLVRLNKEGGLVWSRITNALITDPDQEENFFHSAIFPDSTGIVLQGATYNFNDVSSDDIFICAYDLNGTQLWKKVYGGSSGDSPSGIVSLPDQAYLVLSTVRGGGRNVTSFKGGGTDFWVFRINATGDLLWERTYGGSNLDYPYQGVMNGDFLYIAGSTRSNDGDAIRSGFGGLDAFMFAIDPETGDTISTARWGSSGSDYAHALAFREDNAYVYAAGRTEGNDGFFKNAFGSTDLFLTRFKSAEPQFIPEAKAGGDIRVFPNPSNRSVEIHSVKSGIQSVKVCDLSGKEVYDYKHLNAFLPVHLQFENPGLYQLKVKTIQGVFYSKIVITNY
jgi:hypothetical protein